MKSAVIVLILLIAMATNTLPATPAERKRPYDIIIRNGLIVDGTGKKGYRADLGIIGERITYIGKLPAQTFARRVIDAQGLVVAPGFIDLLGQSEDFLLVDPRAMSKVMQGVTTEVTGEGGSIAPLNDRLIAENRDFYDRYSVKMDWRTFGEYFAKLERQGMGVNLATFVGATQVRAYVMGFDNRPPTKDELEQMKQLVAEAMQDGAWGLSTSLQYIPARFAQTDEIVELAKVAKQYGGIYATHQRSEANDIETSLKEVFDIARRAQIPTEIWHLKTAYKQNWGRMKRVLKLIAEARKSGLDVSADVYPYAAASTSLGACLPPWAQEGGAEKVLQRLKDPATRAKIKADILNTSDDDWENIYMGSGGAAGVLVSSFNKPELEKWQGKRLSEIAKEQRKEDLDALFDLLIADRNGVGAIYFMMNEDDLRAAIKTPFVSFCTDSGARATDGPLQNAKGHPRGWGSYPRILSRYVRDEKLLTLEQAVHKMTAQPAARAGLRERGTLAVGHYADITLFDPAKVQDRATFDNPAQYPTGIPYVIINGKINVDKGQRTAELSGQILRGPGHHENR
jgi:dihydroorotase/N-acyl-D-amino-acid deacylase